MSLASRPAVLAVDVEDTTKAGRDGMSAGEPALSLVKGATRK
jgi:hypothetical protein